jgi:membrane-associated phospholipid phosphatase
MPEVMSHWRSRLLIFGVCLPLAIFLLLTLAVWQQPGGIGWDDSILIALHATRQKPLDQFAGALTELGVYKGVFPAVVLIATILLLRQRWRSLAFVMITALGEILLNRNGKLLIHRPRPHLWETVYSVRTDFAFPSGHAMSSLTLAIILVVLTWRTRWRWIVLVFSSLFAIGVAWTRLYLGAHYPSDIMAGWMLALAWVSLVGLIIYRDPTPESTYLEIPEGRKRHNKSLPFPTEES